MTLAGHDFQIPCTVLHCILYIDANHLLEDVAQDAFAQQFHLEAVSYVSRHRPRALSCSSPAQLSNHRQ